MQVRLYSLAGQVYNLNSAYTEKPVTVQRLPSKLSSLAWDHSQQVCSNIQDNDTHANTLLGVPVGETVASLAIDLLSSVASAEHSLVRYGQCRDVCVFTPPLCIATVISSCTFA